MAHSLINYSVFLLSLLLLALAFPSLNGVEADLLGDLDTVVDATVDQEKTIHVVVEGIVLCQSCQAGTSPSLAGATKIASANISVTCQNLLSDETKFLSTDNYGYFYAETGMKVSNNTLDEPMQSCHVRLVSSPLRDCNQTTNINNGIDGASLRSENKRLSGKHYEAVIYAAGPLAFRPAKC